MFYARSFRGGAYGFLSFKIWVFRAEVLEHDDRVALGRVGNSDTFLCRAFRNKILIVRELTEELQGLITAGEQDENRTSL